VLALSYEMLPRALKAFREKHPGYSITVESLHSPQIMSALLLQEADVGFVFSPAVHPSLTQETLADTRMVCIAPKGMLPRALVRNGSVALHDLADRPVIGLDSRDPVGTSLSQACRQAGVGFQQAVVTVQTYHAALAMAHHGLGVALVDGCTARSADATKVDVLTLEPHIPVPVRALRFAGRPDSVAVRGITRCMQQAIQEAM
jgi:DNA-binding transcriptional LysR family regulator